MMKLQAKCLPIQARQAVIKECIEKNNWIKRKPSLKKDGG
jgi:hypothetical protein